jgi:hypothetical protein
VLGLLLGIVVSVASDLPFTPEGGLVLGTLLLALEVGDESLPVLVGVPGH